jgi:uncharacterized protein (DUF362 family)
VYHAEKILISTDPLALDTTAAAMLGMEVEDIPILESGRESQTRKKSKLPGIMTPHPRSATSSCPGDFGVQGKEIMPYW